MLYHEVLEKATTEDITMFIANRNLDIREQNRQQKRQKAQANMQRSRRR